MKQVGAQLTLITEDQTREKELNIKHEGKMTVKIKEELSLTLRQRPKQTSLTQKQDWMNKGSTKGN